MNPWFPKTEFRNKRRHFEEAFHDGQDSARCGEALPDYWNLIDLGYTPMEALAFIRGYRSIRP